MRHAGVGYPDGAVDNARVFALPSSHLLMCAPEARYHHAAAVAAGKRVLWRAIPRLDARPARVGWSPTRALAETLNLTDATTAPISDFVGFNELDLNYERGDSEDDYDLHRLESRYQLIGGFLAQWVVQARHALPQTRLHFPAFTPDHYALDFKEYWEQGARACDVIDIHAYETLDKIRARYDAHRAAFPDKYLALTEWHCKGNLEEERRVLEWLALLADTDPLFDAAYFFIWRWDNAASNWDASWDIEHSPERLALFMNPPALPEPPMYALPSWTPAYQDILDGVLVVADEKRIPRDLLLGLCFAESGEGLQSFDRWASQERTKRMVRAIDAHEWANVEAIFAEIPPLRTNDISFGPAHQTWRWSPEFNGDPYDLPAIMRFRATYIEDHGHALRVAADQVARFWAAHAPDKVETLCRYNKPDGTASAGVRKRYTDMLAKAQTLLGSGGGVGMYDDFTDPQPGGTFAQRPKGVILHGSRSGRPTNSKATEYLGTARYEVSNTLGLGWNATIGENKVALHIPPNKWGHNARGCSDDYLAVEFAQTTVDEPITDAQVTAFCAWVKEIVLPVYPDLPMHFPTHAELDGTPEYGPYDGKSDVFPRGDARADELRARIRALLQPVVESPYLVGEGILAAMHAHNDAPTTHEVYSPSGWSEAYGQSGSRYVYIAALNRVFRYDPA